MPDYRARDLLLLPNLLSAARVPLAVAFPLVVDRAPLALGVLGVASLTDVLDGWTARRSGQATPVGAVVDGIADKAFGLSVLGSMLAVGKLTPLAALLLATRELGELPLAARFLVSRRVRAHSIDRRANALGKMATTLELGTVVAILLDVPHRTFLLLATAALGGLAAASYWRREIRGAQKREDEREAPILGGEGDTSPRRLGAPASEASLGRTSTRSVSVLRPTRAAPR